MKEQLKEAIQMAATIGEVMLETPEFFENTAKVAMASFKAFKKEGFTDQQATEFTAAMVGKPGGN